VGSYRARTQGRFDRERPWGRFILERHKFLHQGLYPKLLEKIERSELHRITTGQGPNGAISCGGASSLVQAKNHFALGYAYPLPAQQLVAFLAPLARVLIVEEVAPIVETMVRALAHAHGLEVEVRGRLSGHLPRVGPLSAGSVEKAWTFEPEGLNFEVSAEPTGEIFQLPCGGFEPLYRALDALLPEESLVAGDVGCSILHGYFPPQVIDTAYALGTSVATASGMSLAGRKGIAIVGDTGFLHSGITGLLNAVEHGHNVLVIVIHNRISGMTPGHLEIPGMARLRELIAACGPDAVDEIAVEDPGLQEVLAKRLDERGVHVVIVTGQARTWGS
jgi:indolepyruvate ferredoxin oxidoreductase alpha subunit